ncbi:MAG: cytochrome c biogenesis protein CcdA [Ancrocorticia sp.]|nr:cytochrome c biogenesis protein CcdA [Ancrocorticia sp.]
MDSVTLPLAFAAGIVTFASPCFLPIIPVFLTYLAGSTRLKPVPAVQGVLVAQGGEVSTLPQDRWQAVPATRSGTAASGSDVASVLPRTVVSARSTRRRALTHALAFSGAFTLIFVALWAVISAVGWVAADLREPMRIVGGIVLILLGLFAARIVKIPPLDRARSFRQAPAGEPTVAKSVLLGLAFGAGWSPCVGPVLGLILGMALTRETALAGLGLLLVFCLGITTAFVLVALGIDGLMGLLTRLSHHFQTIQVIGGILMIIMGFLLIADLLAPLSGTSWVTI